MMRVVIAVLLLAAGNAGALVVGGPESATPAKDSSGREVPWWGSGWTAMGGYFFKDTMFYSHARGGAHFGVSKEYAHPARFGLWTGAGVFRATGTERVGTAKPYQDSTVDLSFDESTAYGDIGLATPWFPVPICLAVYWHQSELSARGRSGELDKAVYAADKSGVGLGLTVHIILEWFPGKEKRPPRGLGMVIGYTGMMELSGGDVKLKEKDGTREPKVLWRPFKGESLRAGLEYEF